MTLLSGDGQLVAAGNHDVQYILFEQVEVPVFPNALLVRNHAAGVVAKHTCPLEDVH